MSIEIMAPAGDWESMMAAIKAGADSVYFGVSKFNMRSRAAKNFNTSDLKKIAKICKNAGVKTYLTLNSIIYDEDISEMKKICNTAKKAGISAIIAMDIAVMEYARSIKLPVHLSTQTNVSNISAVKFFSKYCDTIILARELTLQQIKKITEKIKKQKILGPSGEHIKIEIFVHGALCVSISGKCYMSLAVYAKSANRGDCRQNCRRTYTITDDKTGQQLLIENGQVMSPKDLCTIGMIDKLMNAGVSVFKIEGRARKADYVYTVVKVYKEAVQTVLDKKYDKKNINEFRERLLTVYNRGFWENGYYLGKDLGEWTTGTKSTKIKEFSGEVKNYFAKNNIGLFKIQSTSLNIGDDIIITGPSTGIVHAKIESIRKNDKPAQSAHKGDLITIPIKEKIRPHDKLFALRNAE